MTAQNEFTRLLTAGDITGYGALCFNSSMKMMDDWSASGHAMFNTWTIFGDPSVRVRTKAPATLSVSHPKVITSLNYPVHVPGVEGALAGLSAGGKYLGSAYTDADGKAVITLDSLTLPTVLQLTVTAFNATPYTSTVTTSEAKFACSPVSFAKKIYQGQSGTGTLIVSNTGPDSSTLRYSVRVIPEYSKAKSRAMRSTDDTRNISGSALTLSASEYTPGECAGLTVTLHNNSHDEEWISEVEMNFPETITVNDATRLEEETWGLTPDGSTGAGATLTWQADNVDSDSVSENAAGTVTLSFAPSAKGPIEICYMLKGDSYGDEPHYVTGVITLEESAPAFAIIAPNGGESWLIGSTQEIIWTSVNYTDTVDIDCSTDGGDSWQPVEEGIENSGYYDWTIDLTQQSNNCLLRITATDGSASVTSTAPFSIYHSLDWLTIVNESDQIIGNTAEIITLEFDASGKSTGTYRAVLEVISNVGTSQIPVEMTVLPPEPEWIIWAEAGEYGSITPAGITTIANGGFISFMVQADDGYHIRQLIKNGTSVSEAAGLTAFTSFWNNVQADGKLQALFAKNIDIDTFVPTAYPGSCRIKSNTRYTGKLRADNPVIGSATTFQLLAAPANGVAAVNSDGSFSYTPAINYLGPDEFTFQVITSYGQDSAIVSIDISNEGVLDWVKHLMQFLYLLLFGEQS